MFLLGLQDTFDGNTILATGQFRPGHEPVRDEAEGRLELSRKFKTSLELAWARAARLMPRSN